MGIFPHAGDHGHRLHNWDDDNVRRIAANCARAVPPGDWLVVMDMALPSAPQPAMGHLMDVLMMVLVGGAERTPEQYQALIEPAGYTLTREVPLPVDDTGRQPPWRALEFRRD